MCELCATGVRSRHIGRTTLCGPRGGPRSGAVSEKSPAAADHEHTAAPPAAAVMPCGGRSTPTCPGRPRAPSGAHASLRHSPPRQSACALPTLTGAQDRRVSLHQRTGSVTRSVHGGGRMGLSRARSHLCTLTVADGLHGVVVDCTPRQLLILIVGDGKEVREVGRHTRHPLALVHLRSSTQALSVRVAREVDWEG